MAFFVHLSNSSRSFQQRSKRAFDIITAAAGLVILSPSFMLILLAIKIDSRGPVFRRHIRYGYNAKEVLVLKFRSEQMTQTGRYSSRLTRVGRILRQSGIEDLPQFVNVLRGEMSIVGPKPLLAVTQKRDQKSGPSRQHNTKPGILGLAQVHNCWGETGEALERRIKFDADYIEHWSFLLDIKIVVRTLFSTNTY
jgi:putative colanic acid biosynthesis UDP-glucose lipid carrier transferase